MKEDDINTKHPYELFGVECGKGWYDLLKPIFKYVENYNKDKPQEEHIEFLQIKEKFGGLRVYTDFLTEELSRLIDTAEEESFSVCENCGSKNNVGSRLSGWISTMCLECLKKEVKEQGYPQLWNRNSDNKTYWINPDDTIKELTKEEYEDIKYYV